MAEVRSGEAVRRYLLRVLQLRVFADPATADVVVPILVGASGVRHVERSDPIDATLQTLVTADLDAETADEALAALAGAGVPRSDVYLVRFDPITPLALAGSAWLPRAGDSFSWTELLATARANARPVARYLAGMAAAGSIASVGVVTVNTILIVGAMAVSPDLLTLSAICVGLAGRRWRLLTRAGVTLLAGFLVAALFAGITGAILDHTGFLHALGSGGLGTLTTTDITTVLVALAAGVAGMLAFETRAAAAVGVAISITTIPALAYFAVAVVADDPNDAWGALGVLVTNVLVLVAAGTLTVAIQRTVRAHQERRAPACSRRAPRRCAGRGHELEPVGEVGVADEGEQPVGDEQPMMRRADRSQVRDVVGAVPRPRDEVVERSPHDDAPPTAAPRPARRTCTDPTTGV